MEPLVDVRVLEEVTARTLLGIRFWDPALDEPVRDDLIVRARRVDGVGPERTAVRTSSGLWAFHGLPGLRALERDEEPDFLSPPEPISLRFLVGVEDARRRFLPVAFTVDLPLPYRGPWNPGLDASPLSAAAARCYLFSSPNRPAGPGLAAVRALLADADHSGPDGAPEPAAHALLELELEGGDRWYGLADRRGSVTVLLPWPTVIGTIVTSPPNGTFPPLAEQRWRVTVRVRWSPGLPVQPIAGGAPDLRAIRQQEPARLAPDAGPTIPELEAELAYGRELVLRTSGRPELLIEAAGSPP
ncbi:MAG TPA: hypothetical protein VEW48_21845 [Thermoanaerobaculia bacterium]|nr:hypothetical protein [Thermoanaerobaculia bacterium]